MPSLPSNNVANNDKKVTDFFDKYYTKSISFPTNDVNAVVGYLEKRGFSSEAARATTTVLLTQAKLDENPVCQLLDTLKGLSETQLSNGCRKINCKGSRQAKKVQIKKRRPGDSLWDG